MVSKFLLLCLISLKIFNFVSNKYSHEGFGETCFVKLNLSICRFDVDVVQYLVLGPLIFSQLNAYAMNVLEESLYSSASGVRESSDWRENSF